MNDALLLDFNTRQQFLLQDIRLIEEQDQMDMSQEGAGTYRVERLEGVVDPIHLGTRVSGPVQHNRNGLRRENAVHHGFMFVSSHSENWIPSQ